MTYYGLKLGAVEHKSFSEKLMIKENVNQPSTRAGTANTIRVRSVPASSPNAILTSCFCFAIAFQSQSANTV